MDLDYIIRRTEAVPREQRLNAAKEALQESLLAAMGMEGSLANVAFQGGTALRVLHRLPRYSEDLNFIWTGSPPAASLLREWPKIISRHLNRIGLILHLSDKINTIATRVPKRIFTTYLVATAPKLAALFRGELQVSLEIDLDPPRGYEVERKLVTIANQPVALPALTLPSLMAGKLHILLTRTDREKGRDWYDYLWYRKRGIEPNLTQLQNAVDQTNQGVPAQFWMSLVRERLATTDWPAIRRDVGWLLERPEELKLLSELGVDSLTPHPDFAGLLAEVQREHALPPAWGTATTALQKDIADAALSGDVTANELRETIERMGGPGRELTKPK